MRRANIVKEARVVHVVVSSLLLLSGILIVAWPELDTEALQWLIGINLIVTGAARVLGYYANDLYRLAFQYDLAMGPFCIILGVLWLIYPQNVIEILPLVIGIFITLDGLLKLQTAFDAKAFGMRQWWGLLTAASIVAVFGVVVLVLSVVVPQARLAGAALILDGAENVWNTMGTVRVRAKKANRFEENFDNEK